MHRTLPPFVVLFFFHFPTKICARLPSLNERNETQCGEWSQFVVIYFSDILACSTEKAVTHLSQRRSQMIRTFAAVPGTYICCCAWDSVWFRGSRNAYLSNAQKFTSSADIQQILHKCQQIGF